MDIDSLSHPSSLATKRRVNSESRFWNALLDDFHPLQTMEKDADMNFRPRPLKDLSPLPVNYDNSILQERNESQRNIQTTCFLPEGFPASIICKPVYSPPTDGPMNGLSIRNTRPARLIFAGTHFSTHINTGILGNQKVSYLSKSWLTLEPSRGFFSEIALYKSQLKPLQGKVVPAVMGVYTNMGNVSVAMKPPHHSFWIEASPDMPHVLKKRCVEAFRKVHAVGVCHGNVQLSNFLIGGDASVQIINFQDSRALVPNPSVHLEVANLADLQLEMKQLKALLNYGGTRAREKMDYAGNPRPQIDGVIDYVQFTNQSEGMENVLDGDEGDSPQDAYYLYAVPPRRFELPGQSAAELQLEIRLFLDLLQAKSQDPSPTPLPPLHHDKSPEPDHPPILAAPNPLRHGSQTENPTVPVTVTHCYEPGFNNFSQPLKRKNSDDVGPRARPRKRLCSAMEVPAVIGEPPSPSGYQSAALEVTETTFPQIHVRDFAYGSQPPKQRTIDRSIQRYVDLESPHLHTPKRDLTNPRWRIPIVTKHNHYNHQVEPTQRHVELHPYKHFQQPKTRIEGGSLRHGMVALSKAPGDHDMQPPKADLSGTPPKKRKRDLDSGDYASSFSGTSSKLKLGNVATIDLSDQASWDSSGVSKNLTIHLSEDKLINRHGISQIEPDLLISHVTRSGPHGDQISSLIFPSWDSTWVMPWYRRQVEPRNSSASRQTIADRFPLPLPAPVPLAQRPQITFTSQPVNDLDIAMTVTPPYAGLLRRCMGGFVRLLR